MWRIIHSNQQSAQYYMDLDAKLLKFMKRDDHPILHFYDWIQPSMTYGYFIDPSRFINLKKAKQIGLDYARRPTGGGMIIHSWDLTFSILLPASHPSFSLNTLDNYHFINSAVKMTLNHFFKSHPKHPLSLLQEETPSLDPQSHYFCMAQPTQYDVMFKNKKIAGGAQRRRKEGFLHQGSITIATPDKHFIENVLLPHTKQVYQAMLLNTYPLCQSRIELETMRTELKRLLEESLTHA